MNYKDIPIIINAYNRYNCMLDLIKFLENTGHTNIILLDNGSTYEPLLNYYSTTKHRVEYLNKNVGHLALWDSGFVRNFRGQYYVYTDPDVVPIEECPENFMEYFYETLQQYKNYLKIGFSLKTDDLPDHSRFKSDVIGWEAQHWADPIVQGKYYRAPIDTTFAMYAPKHPGGWSWSIRTDAPYMARHTSWYLDHDNLPDDETYYKNNLQTKTHWSKGL